MAVTAAAQGCDIVFHVAAKAGIWGDYADYHAANVTGTEAVLAACRANGIRRLVATGSPSVVFDGSDIEGGDESLPYPDHYEAHYPQTKMLAERLVLQANSPELATVSLRPHLIWGPGDNHLVPRIIAKAKRGQAEADRRASLPRRHGLCRQCRQSPSAGCRPACAGQRRLPGKPIS